MRTHTIDGVERAQITASVADFIRLAGIHKTTVYRLLKDGEIAAIKVGKRRLIVLSSYHALIRRQIAEQERRAAAGPDRRPAPRGRGWLAQEEGAA